MGALGILTKSGSPCCLYLTSTVDSVILTALSTTSVNGLCVGGGGLSTTSVNGLCVGGGGGAVYHLCKRVLC